MKRILRIVVDISLPIIIVVSSFGLLLRVILSDHLIDHTLAQPDVRSHLIVAKPGVRARAISLHFVGPKTHKKQTKIGMVVELVPQLRPGNAPRVMLRLVRDGELVPHGVRFGLGTLEKPGLQGVH